MVDLAATVIGYPDDIHPVLHGDLRVLGSLDYPPALATIAAAPHLLYARGTIETRDANAVALVGSRDCTAYGKRVAEKLAGDLARAGWTVVSGLAHHSVALICGYALCLATLFARQRAHR